MNSAPGVLLASFTVPVVPASSTSTLYTLTPSAPFVLAPATTYWFVLSSPTDLGLTWDRPDPAAAPTAFAVSYVGYRVGSVSSGTTTWSTSSVFNGVDIKAQVVPEPATFALLGLPVLALLRRRKA